MDLRSELRRLARTIGAAALALCLALVVAVSVHAFYPSAANLTIIGFLFDLFLSAASFAGILFALYLWEAYPSMRKAMVVVGILTTGTLLAHLYIIGLPPTSSCQGSTGEGGCVMDEVYYVPSAEGLLAGEKCSPGADSCNLEHPFLSKAFIAAGIAILGNNVVGWRIFNVLLGTFSIPLMFALSYVVSRRVSLSLIATAFLSFDTLFFVHSSIAVIDVPAIFFALVAFLVYFGRASFWLFDRMFLAGMLLGVSALAKETSVFFVLILVSYHLLWSGEPMKERLIGVLSLAVMVVLVFGGGLQVYDAAFVPSYGSFLSNIVYIIDYGKSLIGGGWVDTRFGNYIVPLDWLIYYSPVPYLVTTTTSGSLSYVQLGYWGTTNFVEVWLVWIWVPYVCYLLYNARRPAVPEPSAAEVHPDEGSMRAARLALLWFAWIYFAYLALGFYGRVTYPYYFIQAIPAVALGGAFLLTRSWFKSPLRIAIIVAVAAWFVVYYPDKSFFPVWLRAALGT